MWQKTGVRLWFSQEGEAYRPPRYNQDVGPMALGALAACPELACPELVEEVEAAYFVLAIMMTREIVI